MNALALMVACERAQRTYELPPGRRSTTGERITLRGAHPPVLALPATDGELVDERRQLPDPFRPAVQRPAAPFEVLDAEERIALRPAAV